MNPVEANVATQVADVSRPVQTHNDRSRQVKQATVESVHNREDDSPAVTADELRGDVDRLQRVVEAASGRALAFDINDDTEELFVEVRDVGTDEVIKKIPSDAIMAMRARIEEALGILLDESA